MSKMDKTQLFFISIIIIIAGFFVYMFIANNQDTNEFICGKYESAKKIEETNINGLDYIIIGEGTTSLTIKAETIYKNCNPR